MDKLQTDFLDRLAQSPCKLTSVKRNTESSNLTAKEEVCLLTISMLATWIRKTFYHYCVGANAVGGLGGATECAGVNSTPDASKPVRVSSL